eukprot:3666635-Pyramimonas_sp.AAC.1
MSFLNSTCSTRPSPGWSETTLLSPASSLRGPRQQKVLDQDRRQPQLRRAQGCAMYGEPQTCRWSV